LVIRAPCAVVDDDGALDQKVAGLDQKVAGLDRQFGTLEQKFDALGAKVERQLDAFRRETANNQRWLVGLQVTTLLVVIGAVFAR
jgi:hypothetical protein